jgi:hypothetical protein
LGIWTTTIQDEHSAIGATQSRSHTEACGSGTDDHYICIHVSLLELVSTQDQPIRLPSGCVAAPVRVSHKPSVGKLETTLFVVFRAT